MQVTTQQAQPWEEMMEQNLIDLDSLGIKYYKFPIQEASFSAELPGPLCSLACVGLKKILLISKPRPSDVSSHLSKKLSKASMLSF